VYRGLGAIYQDFGLFDIAQDTSDFALLDVGSVSGSVNGYCDPQMGQYVEVQGHLAKHELEEGQVKIITISLEVPIMGYLLKGDARIVFPGGIMRTRRIQIDIGFKARK
jgi:hypothetical protein